MKKKLAVIGVGNMAKAILAGIVATENEISDILLYDKNTAQYNQLPQGSATYHISNGISEAVSRADCVLLSVKPQNFAEILNAVTQAENYSSKLFVSIAAGIDTATISTALNGANVVRVLPNLPMTIGQGVSLICKNERVSDEDMKLVQRMFSSSGSYTMIEERDMNRMIGVTSSSPAYVFLFADAIYQGALAQGLPKEGLMDAICDMIIGSASLLKQSGELPSDLIAKVASKGGTTEQALRVLNESGLTQIVTNAMIACTNRANELGKKD